jgi:hypothetical protein
MRRGEQGVHIGDVSMHVCVWLEKEGEGDAAGRGSNKVYILQRGDKWTTVSRCSEQMQ